MPDVATTGSIRPPARGAAASDAPASGTPKPSPISDTVIFVAPPDREARLESRAPVIAKVQRTSLPRCRVSTMCWSACSLRSTRSRAARWRRSRRSKTAWKSRNAPDARRHHRSRPRHGAAGSRHPALRRRRPLRSGKTAPRRRRLRNASSTASTPPAPRSSGSTARWRWCPIASR